MNDQVSFGSQFQNRPHAYCAQIAPAAIVKVQTGNENAITRYESRSIASTLGILQVLSRFILNEPLSWSEIAIRLDIIWMVMFGVVIAFREGAQVPFLPIAALVEHGTRLIAFLQQGRIAIYLLYSFVTLLVLLILTRG